MGLLDLRPPLGRQRRLPIPAGCGRRTNFRPTGRHVELQRSTCSSSTGWSTSAGDYDVITEEDLHREGLDLLRAVSASC